MHESKKKAKHKFIQNFYFKLKISRNLNLKNVFVSIRAGTIGLFPTIYDQVWQVILVVVGTHSSHMD
jgi:hypothetical protein